MLLLDLLLWNDKTVALAGAKRETSLTAPHDLTAHRVVEEPVEQAFAELSDDTLHRGVEL